VKQRYIRQDVSWSRFLQITLLLNLTFPMRLTVFTVEICCKRSLTEYLSHLLSYPQPTQSRPYCFTALSGCFHNRACSNATHWARFCFAIRFSRYLYPGMRSSRTVLDLEDGLRTTNRGLGLGLEEVWPWSWPSRRRPLALACTPVTQLAKSKT